MADGQFHRDADPAVGLHRALPGDLEPARDLGLDQADRGLAFGGGDVKPQGAHQRHRGDLLRLDQHVGHAVLERLELADGLAELLALLGIVHRAFEQLAGNAGPFGADRDGGFIDDPLDQVDPAGQQRIAGDGAVFEVDFRRAEAVNRGVIAARNAGAVRIDQEQLDALALPPAAAGAGRDEQVRGPRRGIDAGLVAIEDEARAVGLGSGGDVGQVVAALRLGIGKGDGGIARDDAGDHRIGHRAAHGLERAAADHDGLEPGFDRDDLAQFLHHDHVLDRAAAHAAVFLGKGGAGQAQLARQRFPDAGIAPFGAGQHLLAGFEVIRVSQKARERIAQHVLGFGVAQIH